MSNNALQLATYTLEGGQVLTADTVRNYLTSGNGKVSDQEVLMFIELCKAQNLNPFVRDAYLVKMGDSYPAQIIVGKDVFIKRASEHPNFNGMRAGIVVLDKNGQMQEREGALKLSGEELVGGWCEVYVKDMKFPIKSTVSLEEYSKSQATWKQMPCVMIRKCAIVTALREAFPEDLQGLYDASEMGVDTKLPEKEVRVGYATTGQKQGIMKMASLKGLYDYENPKDISKLNEFCESNGYELKNLKFEEVEELVSLLANYEPKQQENKEIQDVEYTEITEDNIDDIEVQETLL